jgi:uroporphyrinogen decarboxylase
MEGASMSPRERVNAAVRRQPVDRVPKEMSFTPVVARQAQENLGPNVEPSRHFGWETRGVGFRGPREPSDFSVYYHGVKGVYWDRDYGTGEVMGNFHHFSRKVFPLGEVRQLRTVEQYPWPDFTPAYRHDHLEAEVAHYHGEGWHVSGWVGHVWETGWQMLGLERTLADLVTEPDVALYVLDRICANNCFKARRFAEAGVDMLRLGDDVGMQDRLMMQPGLWRKVLKPLLKRQIDAARAVNPELPVWYHSDGDISAIIEDLIEVGVTVLNPVQPECLDLTEVHRRYGERLSFWGCIGTQSTMPWGSAEDVRQAVRAAIEIMAPGLVLAPTHVLEPEVPWANVVAFHEAIDEFGVFER